MLLYKKTGHSGYSLADVSRFFYDYFFSLVPFPKNSFWRELACLSF